MEADDEKIAPDCFVCTVPLEGQPFILLVEFKENPNSIQLSAWNEKEFFSGTREFVPEYPNPFCGE